jgi:hypothetical protein
MGGAAVQARFERVASENERAGALPWTAHARLDHARLLLAVGDRAAAESLAEKVSAIYHELGMDAWVRRCREAMASASGLAVMGRR